MLGVKFDYTGNAVLIYTAEGEYIQKSEIAQYNKRNFQLKLRGGLPSFMKEGDVYALLVLAEPSPREYEGRVEVDKTDLVLVLYRGKEKESRRSSRYKVNFNAKIVSLVRHEEIFPLHTPLDAVVINISQGGLRISAPVNSLRKGDKMQIMVQFETTEKLMTALVTNYLDSNEYASEYGCGLMGL
ncbi:MAG: PilZ domain-containing protein [Defluviitaleaceae bacterium]|nr:PilZ domain-containing protein [Defluviitaleaceae bacterium]MCL2238793.1 PilZ domain-containing protein [Defluviitaleaceae bacterium]